MSGIQTTVVAILAILGTAFMLLASVGILRMPDLYTRLQAASKASTLGAICVLLAAGLYFAEKGILVRALLTAGFVFLTGPIAAYQIARSGYLAHAPLETGTVIDELQGRYDASTGSLASPDHLEGEA